MASAETMTKVKTDLRISHTALDGDLADQIDACLQDLSICGINSPDETNPAILAAVKLYCRAQYTDDTGKAAAYMERYNSLKACLMMAGGYGGAPDAD